MSESEIKDKRKDKKWIVLVEDNEDDLHMMAWMFYEVGEAVAGFTTGKAAIDFIKLRSGKIKCVILDLSLEPSLDGLTLAEQIRLNEETFQLDPVPIAFLTAHHQQKGGATERIAAKCNVERIWHKPEDTPQLIENVSEWLTDRTGANIETKTNETKEISNHAI